MDPHRLIASLDATFEAALARQEERAASKLAFSLLQERYMREVLARMGPAIVAFGRWDARSSYGRGQGLRCLRRPP